MDLNHYCIKKSDVLFVNEDTTLKEASDLMEKHHFRCIPILDKSGTLFRGTIYRQHIYQHLLTNGSLDLPVTYLLKNATKYIFTDSSFYQIIFAIRDLPYISILDKDHTFAGILTHRAFEKALYRAWGLNQESYVLTLSIPQNKKGFLAKATRIIGRYCSITAMISLANETSKSTNYVTVNLDKDCNENTLHKIYNGLERHNIEVVATTHTRDIFL